MEEKQTTLFVAESCRYSVRTLPDLLTCYSMTLHIVYFMEDTRNRRSTRVRADQGFGHLPNRRFQMRV